MYHPPFIYEAFKKYSVDSHREFYMFVSVVAITRLIAT